MSTNGAQPIFLRAAHSPWRPLNQNALGYIRAAILAYLIATGAMVLDYKMKHRDDEHTNWRIPFQFSTLVWVMLIIYHFLVTVRWPRGIASYRADFVSGVDHHTHALA